METIVVYTTKTGSTKKYANWIGKAIDAKVLTFAEAESSDLDQFDRVIVSSGTYAGRMPLTKFLKQKWDVLESKKVVVVAVGDVDPDHVWSKFSYKLIPKKIRDVIKYYKLPGDIGKVVTEDEANAKLGPVLKYLQS